MTVQPSKIAYITGSSKGIGKAIAELLLDKGYQVVGISRTNDIQHPNFEHYQLDLSDIKALSQIEFRETEEGALLINNAGVLGEVGPVGQIENNEIHKSMNVNTISPQILTNSFINYYKDQPQKFHVLNISSGAGKRPITSWATYCASKAALDLFSETIAEEFKWKQWNNWHIHSVAPGVVDTKMQEQIRSTKPANFEHVQKFIDFKKNDDLYSPKYVAEKLWMIVQKPEEFVEVLVSVRDF